MNPEIAHQFLISLGEIWNEIVNPTHPLWISLCGVSCLLLVFNTYCKIINISQQLNIAIGWFLTLQLVGTSLIIFSFIAPGSPFLVTSIKTAISSQNFIAQTILDAKVSGIQISEAIASRNLTAQTNQYLAQSFANCTTLISESSLRECFNNSQTLERVLAFSQGAINDSNGHLLSGNLLTTFLDSLEGDKKDSTLAHSDLIIPQNVQLLNLVFQTVQAEMSKAIVLMLMTYTTLAPLYVSFAINPYLNSFFYQWLSQTLHIFFGGIIYIFIYGITAVVELKLSNAGLSVGSATANFNDNLGLGLILPLTLFGAGMGSYLSGHQAFTHFGNSTFQPLQRSIDSQSFKRMINFMYK